MKQSLVNRRRFLQSSAAVTAAPYFFSATRSLADETQSANDRFRVGVIGAGGMGTGNMHAAKRFCDVVAICDVDRRHAGNMNRKLGKDTADIYLDYRDLLERDDLDAIHIATPDHWHAKPVIEGMLAGHDIYCEKPLTLTIDEGRQICDVQKRTGQVVQVGTQQRSTFDLFAKAIAIVQSGRLGKINRIVTCIGGAPSSGAIPVAPAPEELDWDRWLGPAPLANYRFVKREGDKRAKTRCHYEFRWWYEYSGGKLTDWGAHHVDIACWALEANGQRVAPVSVSGQADHPVPFENGEPTMDDRYNTAKSFDFVVEMADGAQIEIHSSGRNGALIEGEKGRIFVSRGKLEGAPVEALAEDPLPEDAMQKIYKGAPLEHNERVAHWANFFHCVRERAEPVSDVHSHMRALDLCHLAGIVARLGRSVTLNPETGQIEGDELAQSMTARPYRKGYEIEA